MTPTSPAARVRCALWPIRRNRVQDDLVSQVTTVADRAMRRRLRAREDAEMDHYIEMVERSALPCLMCDDVGEPHACEREWWRQQLAHRHGQSCADHDCPCHEAARLDIAAANLRRYCR